jgi:hypothetical protein
LVELEDHEDPEGGLVVLGPSQQLRQPVSHWAIEPECVVHGKVPSIFVGGLATATIDGVTFPFNFLPAIPTTSGDHESRTVV